MSNVPSDNPTPPESNPQRRDRPPLELFHKRRKLTRALGEAMLRIRELEAKVYKDPLTGEANRNLFDEKFEDLVRTARQRDEPLALLVADIDGLKRVNDKCGHKIGDRVIRAGATGLRKAAREGDLVIRIGGDELCVVLPGFTPLKGQSEDELYLDTTSRVAESTTEEIGSLGLPEELKIGMSFAIAILKPDETAEAFYQRVDAQVRANKEARTAQLASEGIVFHDSRMLPN